MKIYKYLSLMKFDDELRWGLELSLYKLPEKDLEKDYEYKIPISDKLYEKLNNKFYKNNGDE